MTETIVVGTDGSAAGSAAVGWAAREAVRWAASLLVVHALPTWAFTTPPASRHPEVGEWWRSEAQRVAREAAVQAERAAPGAAVRAEVRAGEPAAVLRSTAQTARMVVVGDHGVGRVRGLLLGSTGLKLAGRTPCPLVVVRGEPRAESGEIVVGVDGSPGSLAAAEFALGEAARRKAELRAVDAWSPPLPAPGIGEGLDLDVSFYEEESARSLAHVFAVVGAAHPEVSIRRDPVYGHPVDVLTEASRTADLLVVGSRGRGGLAGLVLGSISHGVLHRSTCPVAVVS